MFMFVLMSCEKGSFELGRADWRPNLLKPQAPMLLTANRHVYAYFYMLHSSPRGVRYFRLTA